MSSIPSPSRPVKTCSNVALQAAGFGPMILTITSGRKFKTYRLSPLPCDDDFGRCFTVEYTPEEVVCRVRIDGQDTSCDCPGFEYTGGCKHVAAILELIGKGSL